jgi:hypothetical protein
MINEDSRRYGHYAMVISDTLPMNYDVLQSIGLGAT